MLPLITREICFQTFCGKTHMGSRRKGSYFQLTLLREKKSSFMGKQERAGFKEKWLPSSYTLKHVKSVGERLHIDMVSLGMVCEGTNNQLQVYCRKDRRHEGERGWKIAFSENQCTEHPYKLSPPPRGKFFFNLWQSKNETRRKSRI